MSVAGNYHGNGFSGVDSKGRFTLPVDLRRRVRAGSGDANQLLINLTSDRPCIVGFGGDYLAAIEQEIEEEAALARAQGQPFNKHQRAAQLTGSVQNVVFDDGGRFALPDPLKRMMGIENSLFFVGALWTFEIWSPERFVTSDYGSDYMRLLCQQEMDDWAANPKNPMAKGA